MHQTQEKVDVIQMLEQGEIIKIQPQGYSMYPMLVPGRDYAIIEMADRGKVRRGDVILYRREHSILVLHRVWKRDGDRIWFVGDNQVQVEGPLKIEQVKGILVAFEHKGKEISCDHAVYVVLSRLWLALRPVRFLITKPIAKLKRKIRRSA